MERLIYHRPMYAILDECTSAVSIRVKGHLYSYMKSVEITLITVSYRDTHWKNYDYMLRFKGASSSNFIKCLQTKKSEVLLIYKFYKIL